MHDTLKEKILNNFTEEAQSFVNATHDVIHINDGNDGLTKQAIHAFIPHCLSFLKEEGMDYRQPEKTFNLTDASSTITQIMMSKASPEQKTYISENNGLYQDTIKTAMTREMTAQAVVRALNGSSTVNSSFILIK